MTSPRVFAVPELDSGGLGGMGVVSVWVVVTPRLWLVLSALLVIERERNNRAVGWSDLRGRRGMNVEE